MRKDAARNRELLIDAAREVFASRGIEASLDEIAKHAGLGVGTAYRHFYNKHELVAACAQQALDRVVEIAEQALRVEDPWQAIGGFFEGVLRLQAESRGLREVFLGDYDPDEVGQPRERLVAALSLLLARGQRAGVVREDAEPSDLGFLVLMLCSVTDVAGSIAPDMWQRYLPMVLDGLRPGGADFGGRALSAEEMADAIAAHKKELIRATHIPRPE